jgi:hypothetical protein
VAKDALAECQLSGPRQWQLKVGTASVQLRCGGCYVQSLGDGPVQRYLPGWKFELLAKHALGVWPPDRVTESVARRLSFKFHCLGQW